MVRKPDSVKMIALSVDVEPDFPPQYSSFDGIAGLKVIVDALQEKKCNATFFVCADLIDKNPGIIDLLKGFEIGCYGLRHVDLTTLNELEAGGEIAEAYEIFMEHKIKPLGFRAPYCSTNYKVLSEVKKYFEYDSSMQFYGFGRMPGLKEVPVFTGGKMFGISPSLFRIVSGLPVKNKVYFTHPWEYGGFDFSEVAERRKNMRLLGYSKENYLKNLSYLLKKGTCAIKELL